MGVTTNIMDNEDLSQRMQYKNAEMLEIARQYQQELSDWYDNPAFTDNPFPTATQSLWYQNYLKKRRLASKNIKLKYESSGLPGQPNPSSEGLPIFTYTNDGKNMHCTLKTRLSSKRTWIRNQQVIKERVDDNLISDYHIIQSGSPQGKCVCPNCGHEGSMEEMMDGCDYCGTHFHIEDFRQKVASFFISGSKKYGRANKLTPIFWLPLLQIAVGFLVCIYMPIPLLWRVLGFIGNIVLFVGLLILCLNIGRKQCTKQSNATLDALRRVDPYFSEEYFVGRLEDKIASIHFAGNMSEIQSFVYCDISNILPVYQDILECTMLGCVLSNYYTDNLYQHLNAELTIHTEHPMEDGKAPDLGIERINLHLIKNVRATTTIVNEAKMFTCKSCGASITLLNGGRCLSCGNTNNINYIDYDWVIAEYHKVL